MKVPNSIYGHAMMVYLCHSRYVKLHHRHRQITQECNHGKNDKPPCPTYVYCDSVARWLYELTPANAL